MVAAKVQIRKTDFWAIWIGTSLDGIRKEVLELRNLFTAETLQEVPLEVAKRFDHYELLAATLKIFVTHGIGGLLLDRIREERRN